MNILFLSIGKLNSIEDKSMYTDLLRQFRDHGHNVFVVSAREKRMKEPTKYLTEKGVSFLRVRIGNLRKTNIVEKGISTLTFEYLILKELKKHTKNITFDLVIYTTPPITFEKVINYIKKRDGAKSYLLLKDIFPQNAIDLNMINEKGLLSKYFRFKEKKLYAQSDFIGCMSKANVDYIVKNNPEISHSKIEVNPNTIEPINIKKSHRQSLAIRKKYNIPINKTVFIYGGNLGKPQGIDFLIDCLRANKDNNQVYFVIAGSGTEFNKLNRFLENEQPHNVQLFERLPKKDYELLVNTCDVGLIFLDKRFTIPNFPSRILTYMQSSIPILAATDPNTDVGQVIKQGRFGFWCESNNIEQFNKKVQKLCNENLRKSLGENARKYLEENYTSNHSYELIMSHFK